MFVPCDGLHPPQLRDYSLILPAVSVGNVGQLAVDLIISTLNMVKVGYIYTDCLVPMAGSDPYAVSIGKSELSINAEVYFLAERKLAVLQIRSPVIKNKSKAFRQMLVSWIKRSEFAQVILLSSSHAYQRDDQQLLGTPFRYLVTPAMQNSVGEALRDLHWKEMETVAAYPGVSESEKRIWIPGGGITKSLYTDSCTEGIHLAVLLKFCSEGDNIPDAFSLVNYLNEWMPLVEHSIGDSTETPAKLKIPNSWRLLFGSGLPPALF
ncbi:proteasome assembly chaperone 2 [Ambystoma mexicanum]|uniref:proteasome assembly chaperone 2 n=1 Tax=Ambystoma mexicanum TaxID=8296 RepID=UPI0037E946E1